MDRNVQLFEALADPTRLRLLNLFAQSGEVCVCELVDALQVPQYNISRHLRLLVRVGLLEDRRRGKWIYYLIAKNLRPYQRKILQSVEQLRESREDFKFDERRAARRLRLRRGGMCCVGLTECVGSALDGVRGGEGADSTAIFKAKGEKPNHVRRITRS